MIDLSVSREKIDTIDQQILHLLEERLEVSEAVAEYKRSTGKKVYDKQREEEKLAVLKGLAENAFNEKAVEELFRQIMSISRKLQYSRLQNDHEEWKVVRLQEDWRNPKKAGKVVYYGTEGTHTQQAMQEVFTKNVDAYSKPTFREVMEEVANGQANYGVLPLENSSTGSIHDTYDLLMEYPVSIVHEHILPIHQALLGVPGAKEEQIQKVYSHPQGLMQCQQYMEAHTNMEGITYKSTAESAKKVAEDGDVTQAAIAGVQAADCYGLEVLLPCINQESANSTRFIVIANEPLTSEKANKVSLCFELPHESGSLYHMLSHFIFNDLNLTMIESRPVPGRNWEYRFFVDVIGNLTWPGMQNACIGIGAEASKLKILGNYEST